MATTLGGYRDNTPAKATGLSEVTVTDDGDKGRLDTTSLLTDTTGNTALINSAGQLHTVMRGIEDTGNSTIIPLLANIAFTGTPIDTLDYSSVSIVIYTDVASAADGLSVQYSSNGTDWHAGEDYDIVAGATKFFTPTMQARYMRVVYTNGTSDQTAFHLHTVLRKLPIKWSSHNIEDPIKDQDDATLTKAVITGKKASGDYDNVSLTNGSNMKVSLEELESSISENSNTQLKVSLYDALGNIVNDEASDSVVVISHAHHEIHGGDHYYVEGYAELGSGVSLFVKLVTPNTTKWAHFVWDIASSLELVTKLTEAPTGGMADGGPATIFNSDRNSANTSGMVITKGVTACTGGTVISEASWGSRASGGGSTRDEELILKQNTTYCREFTSGTNSNIVSFKASWYEHTNKS